MGGLIYTLYSNDFSPSDKRVQDLFLQSEMPGVIISVSGCRTSLDYTEKGVRCCITDASEIERFIRAYDARARQKPKER